jgi:oxygen tolerance protein BatD
MNTGKPIKLLAIVTILRLPFIVLIASFTCLNATAQVKFTTIASSQEIGRADLLQVEFVVENARQIDQLDPPDFPGFRIAQGPIQSSGMSIMNGNTSQYKAVSFVLQPLKTGKFTIQGASAIVDGKRMQSNTVTIVVNTSTAGSSNNNNNSNPFPQMTWPEPPSAAPSDIDREYVLRPGENVKEKIRRNLFVKVQVDKTTCYVGEPIVATYKLYSRLSSESRVTKHPSLNGFSVYDMVDPNTDAASVEKLNGKPFTVHIIRKTQLIPLQAGTIDLDPVEVENTVHFVKGGSKQTGRSSGNTIRDLFDQLSDDNMMMGPEVEENVTLDTKPLAITVKPLPETGKPADYNGAVGSFSIQASLANKNISAQDDMNLQVVIKGKGNLPVINAPQVQWPSGIDAFDPTAKEEVDKTTVPMSGSKTFDYVFTASSPGHYTIPGIHFSYFDPSSQTYKRTGTDSLDFEVTAVAKKGGTSAAVRQPEPAGTGKFLRQYLEWIFAVLILAIVAFFLGRQNIRLRRTQKQKEAEKKAASGLTASRQTTSRQSRQTGTPPPYASPGAMSMVTMTDPLQEAKKLFEEGDYKGFYREVNRAVWKAITNKLDVPASELNKSSIARRLEVKGWDRITTSSLESILNECEMNLYTPAYDPYNMQQLLKQVESVLDKLA